MDTDDLRLRLTRLAERTAPPPADAPSVVRALAARHRVQRRQRLGVAAAVLAVAAVVATVPLVVGGGGGPEVTSVAGGVAVPPADVLVGPTRGSLAGDAAFLDGVRRLPWTSGSTVPASGDPADPGTPDAPLDSRRVLFAGDVAGGRWALVVGENDARPSAPYDAPERQTDLGAISSVAAAWFTGPAGAAADQLTLAGVPRGVPTDQPLSLLDPATGALVLVVAPGDTVEVSDRPEVAADGSVSRSWRTVDAADGVAVVALRPGLTAPAVSYRVTRQGVPSDPRSPDGYTAGELPEPALDVVRLRPAPPASPADRMTDHELRSVLDTTGLTAADVDVTVVWSGDVPAPRGASARLTLLAATLPSGATYLVTPLGVVRPGVEGAGGTLCGSGLRPAGPPVAEQTYAVQCAVTDMTEHSPTLRSLLVVAPGAASVRLSDRDGGELGSGPVTDGVALLAPSAEVTTVAVLDAAGTVLTRTTPLSSTGFGLGG